MVLVLVAKMGGCSSCFRSKLFWIWTGHEVIETRCWVVATQIFFMFNPIWGRWTQFDDHIFQMGWNHQPGWYIGILNTCDISKGWWKRYLELQTTSFCLNGCLVKQPFPTCKDLVRHPIEPTIYKWMFQVPNTTYFPVCWKSSNIHDSSPKWLQFNFVSTKTTI